MYALTLAAQRTHKLCETLHSRIDDASPHEALLEALADLTECTPDGARPLIVGLLNQVHSLGEIVQYRLSVYIGLPTPQAQESLKRSLAALMYSLDNLSRAAAVRH
jgi:hypothetical protein